MSENLETDMAAEAEAPRQVSLVPSEDQGYLDKGGKPRLSVRERMARRRQYDTEMVTLDDGTEVEVRSMLLGERSDMFAELTDEDGKYHGELLQAKYVLLCAYDPDTGEKVFGEDDMEFVRTRSSGYMQPIITAAAKLSGLEKKAEETREDEAKKS